MDNEILIPQFSPEHFASNENEIEDNNIVNALNINRGIADKISDLHKRAVKAFKIDKRNRSFPDTLVLEDSCYQTIIDSHKPGLDVKAFHLTNNNIIITPYGFLTNPFFELVSYEEMLHGLTSEVTASNDEHILRSGFYSMTLNEEDIVDPIRYGHSNPRKIGIGYSDKIESIPGSADSELTIDDGLIELTERAISAISLSLFKKVSLSSNEISLYASLYTGVVDQNTLKVVTALEKRHGLGKN
jgi:hypothetical protein